MKKSTKKLRTLGDLEMKQVTAGIKGSLPPGVTDPGAQVADEPVIPKP